MILSLIEVFKAIETHLQEKGIKYQTRRLNGSIDLKLEKARIVIYEHQIVVSWKLGTTALPLTEYSVDFLKRGLENGN